jgi:hypothetical protein
LGWNFHNLSVAEMLIPVVKHVGHRSLIAA